MYLQRKLLFTFSLVSHAKHCFKKVNRSLFTKRTTGLYLKFSEIGTTSYNGMLLGNFMALMFSPVPLITYRCVNESDADFHWDLSVRTLETAGNPFWES